MQIRPWRLTEKKEKSIPLFLMVTGMILPAEKFTNVEVKNGKVISDGKNEIVMGIGFPGLGESLQLSDIEELKEKKFRIMWRLQPMLRIFPCRLPLQ